ncbi:integrase, catalytic region, zinc finger, CCHC-type containing protein, partial [Tanacetum coccineum]
SAANVQCNNYSEKGHYAHNCPKPKVRDLKYFMEQMLLVKQDEAGVTFTNEQNNFLVADATRMEEIEELSSNICLMARIQPTNIDSDAGPSYNSAFLIDVQKPSTSYVNPLFAKDNQEQKYPNQHKIINDTIGDDQIDSNIIFDEPNVDVNSGSVEYDNNVQASYELEKLV